MQNRHPSVLSQTGPDFAAHVPADGYAWWYLDATSDCGRHGVTVIVMIGCVFSPWYAAARRHGPTDPLDHSAINVALYGAAGHRWALTERGRADVRRDATTLAIGPSAVRWEQDALTIDVDEVTSPWPSRLRGSIVLRPRHIGQRAYVLDANGRHLWMPIATSCPIELNFSSPQLKWRGTAYLDANEGSAPLETDFDSWHWSRASRNGRSVIFYDTYWHRSDGAHNDGPDRAAPDRAIALAVDADGNQEHILAPPLRTLPRTRWGIDRRTRCDDDARPELLETLENGPFYARSLVGNVIGGEAWTAFHESVSLKRFAARWVQTLLPVKLPRHVLRRD